MGFSSLGISGSMVLNYCLHSGHGLFVWLPGTLCSRAVVLPLVSREWRNGVEL